MATKRKPRGQSIVGQEFRNRWSDLRCKIVNVDVQITRTKTGSKKQSVLYEFEVEGNKHAATKNAFEESWVPLDHQIQLKTRG